MCGSLQYSDRSSTTDISRAVVNKKTTVNAEETPNNHAYSYSGTPGRYVVANQDFASSGVDGRVGLGEIHQEPFIGCMQNILEPQKQEDVGWQQSKLIRILHGT
jgi:hypothetical protein